jgi:hypothetical protein
MNSRKYLFWICGEGIATYKFKKNEKFEIIKPSGKKFYPCNNLNEFFAASSWFYKMASIATGEMIDFCLLSDCPFELPDIDYKMVPNSTWSVEEIRKFCKECFPFDSFAINNEDGKSFVVQNGNVPDKSKLKTIYLRCVPACTFEVKTEIDDKVDKEGGSVIYRHYRKKYAERLKKEI